MNGGSELHAARFRAFNSSGLLIPILRRLLFALQLCQPFVVEWWHNHKRTLFLGGFAPSDMVNFSFPTRQPTFGLFCKTQQRRQSGQQCRPENRL